MEDKYSRTLDSAITRMGHLRAALKLIARLKTLSQSLGRSKKRDAYNRFRQADPTGWPAPHLDISEHFLQRTSGSIQETSKSNCTYGILTPILSRIQTGKFG